MELPEQTGLWTMGNGEQVRVCDMGDAHLLNALRLLRKNALRREKRGEESNRSTKPWVAMMFDAERRGGEVWRMAQEIKNGRELARVPFKREV